MESDMKDNVYLAMTESSIVIGIGINTLEKYKELHSGYAPSAIFKSENKHSLDWLLEAINAIKSEYMWSDAKVNGEVVSISNTYFTVVIEQLESKLNDTIDITTITKEIANICDGHIYNRDVPKRAKELASNNNCLIIVGGSDDLAYFYGADCELTKEIEIGVEWLGEESSFSMIRDLEIVQDSACIGLGFEAKDGLYGERFIIYEDESKKDIYGFGLVLELGGV